MADRNTVGLRQEQALLPLQRLCFCPGRCAVMASTPAAQSLGKGSKAFALQEEKETKSALPPEVHRRPKHQSVLSHVHPERKLSICLHYSNIFFQNRNMFPGHIHFTGTNAWRRVHWINRLRYAKPPWVKTEFSHPFGTRSLCPHYLDCTHTGNPCKCSILQVWVSDSLFKTILKRMTYNTDISARLCQHIITLIIWGCMNLRFLKCILGIYARNWGIHYNLLGGGHFHFEHFSQRCIPLFKCDEISMNQQKQRNCELRLMTHS